MLAVSDNLSQTFVALRAHKLRAALTMLGITMGVATLITVMTLIQGANVYVEQKIANLGTDVFQIARTPFAVTDFNVIIKSLKFKKLENDDLKAVEAHCPDCDIVGASANSQNHVRYGMKEITDVSVAGETPNMIDIDTRTLERGRFFTPSESEHYANVCVIGDTLVQQLFAGIDPLGKTIRVGPEEYTVIGTMEKIGSVLGQDQDNYVLIPLTVYLKINGPHSSLMLNIKSVGNVRFENAQGQARQVLRARRHLSGDMEDDFFIGTKDSYMALWKSISGAFFGVFILVSGISATVGGIVIMNVMLVSVTERRKEIGVRRAMGATQHDILRQFLAESIVQCIVGGLIGISIGFLVALTLRRLTPFPAAVQTWVAAMGVILSSIIGLFFGIYPAVRASQLDPIVALRSD